MGIPVIRLNLAPAPGRWRQHHLFIGWLCVGIGVLALGVVGTMSWNAYREAEKKGKQAATYSSEARSASAEHMRVLSQLKAIDVTKELPRWKLAERILMERSNPWSRLFAELERSLVKDVRIRSITQTKTNESSSLRIKGEARSTESEGEFIESLHENSYFDPVVLDREVERQGGGLEFELIIGISPTPPPYESLPLYGPDPNEPRKKKGKASDNPQPVLMPAASVNKPAKSLRIARLHEANPSTPPETPPEPEENFEMAVKNVSRQYRQGRRSTFNNGQLHRFQRPGRDMEAPVSEVENE